MQRSASRLGAAFALAAALVAALLISGCETNPEDTLSVSEGEPMQLGDLLYNIQISRFLNPADPEDRGYLAGQAEPPNRKIYLAVFMQIENTGDGAQQVPTGFKVTDTLGEEFEPLRSRSLFALPLGGRIPPHETLPEPESTAANGPIQGSMVLFLLPEPVLENRPLTLEIPAASGSGGEVELDI